METRKTAIITGASRGIGKAIAYRLAADGVNVIINYYPSLQEEADEVVKSIRSANGEATAIAADITSYEQVENMVKKTVDIYGSVDILVNNAGILRSGLVHKLSIEDWHLVINTCLTGAFYCIKAVVPVMREKQYGRIINISSGAGLHGFKGDSAYSAAKAGIIGFSKTLAKELSDKGILTNVVVPGLIMTEMTAELPEKNKELMKNMIPAGELGEPEAVANAVSFLALQNQYITGDVLCVDGGLNI
ncbi:3-oxoacyl-ACP reductase family protein [Syntrophomonas curvata]